jgi:hypothetical protein
MGPLVPGGIAVPPPPGYWGPRSASHPASVIRTLLTSTCRRPELSHPSRSRAVVDSPADLTRLRRVTSKSALDDCPKNSHYLNSCHPRRAELHGKSRAPLQQQGQHHRRQQYQRPRRTSRSSTTQSPNSQLPSIGLINNLRTAIDPQSQVEVPRHQARRSLTPRVDKKSTHARCGGDRCGVSLSGRP